MSYDNSGKLGFSVMFWFYCTGVGGQVLCFEWEAVCCVYASMELSDLIIYLCFKWTYMLLKCLSWNPPGLQCVLPFFFPFFCGLFGSCTILTFAFFADKLIGFTDTLITFLFFYVSVLIYWCNIYFLKMPGLILAASFWSWNTVVLVCACCVE